MHLSKPPPKTANTSPVTRGQKAKHGYKPVTTQGPITQPSQSLVGNQSGAKPVTTQGPITQPSQSLVGNQSGAKPVTTQGPITQPSQSLVGSPHDSKSIDQKLTEFRELPESIRALLVDEINPKPDNLEQLLRIAEKLKRFNIQDFQAYKLLDIKATDDLGLFEKSVDVYLARKDSLRKALDEELKKTPKASTEGDFGKCYRREMDRTG